MAVRGPYIEHEVRDLQYRLEVPCGEYYGSSCEEDFPVSSPRQIPKYSLKWSQPKIEGSPALSE